MGPDIQISNLIGNKLKNCKLFATHGIIENIINLIVLTSKLTHCLIVDRLLVVLIRNLGIIHFLSIPEMVILFHEDRPGQ